MRSIGLLVALCVVLALACAQQTGETDYEIRAMLLPVGDPEAGRNAFASLACASCHTVAWDKELPAPTDERAGPELGLDAVQPVPGGLASSIVAPSHQVAERYRQPGMGDRSPMPPYTQTMTIQQLADIVAYLQRQGLETQARTGGGAPG